MSEMGIKTERQWTQFPALAERLGVRPMAATSDADTAELTIVLPDGRRYDIIAIIDALLDRIDSMSQSLMLRS